MGRNLNTTSFHDSNGIIIWVPNRLLVLRFVSDPARNTLKTFITHCIIGRYRLSECSSVAVVSGLVSASPDNLIFTGQPFLEDIDNFICLFSAGDIKF